MLLLFFVVGLVAVVVLLVAVLAVDHLQCLFLKEFAHSIKTVKTFSHQAFLLDVFQTLYF